MYVIGMRRKTTSQKGRLVHQNKQKLTRGFKETKKKKKLKLMWYMRVTDQFRSRCRTLSSPRTFSTTST